MPNKCPWCMSSELMQKYHDEEWGVAVHEDNKLFEFFVLDAFQAGLSWSTILNKRENFRKAFAGFDPSKISKFSQSDIDRLLNDEGIIRNKLKIHATINNAKLFLTIQKEHGSFDKYIWAFTNGKTIQNKRKSISEVPATSKESDAMSKQLKKDGFKFVGSTICYAFMQAAGLVNDHLTDCFRYNALIK